ncbi:hypothetical protein ES708_07804 [subsurface metagenome]
MKTLPAPKFLIYATLRAVTHPRTAIAYWYCTKCNLRFNINEKACPRCHDKVGHSPEDKRESPIPWWGAVLVIIIGIICWVTSSLFSIAGLDEAGRALVYTPLGGLFGLSMRS